LIEPVLKDQAFLSDIEHAPEGTALSLWWLGQSGFLLKWRTTNLLIDPYLSDSLTEKYAGTATPHVRMTSRVVHPSELRNITAVAVTHHHSDHADPQTLQLLFRANPSARLIAPAASEHLIRSRLEMEALATAGLDDRTTVEVGECSITGIASAHEDLERDHAGRSVYLGYIIRLGRWTIYHSGDTVIYEGLASRLQSYGIDIALLPINGLGKGVAGNMDASEAVRLGKQISARCVIPCHFDMFAFNTGSPEQFRDAASKLALNYRIARCGERLVASEIVTFQPE
jgi:L-ascorbate metabolism protein UlaG (beta-lactamase superfamily)